MARSERTKKLAIAVAALMLPIAVPGADGATVDVAGCDFDADGYADLVIAAPGETIAGRPSAGAVHVLYGSEHGVTGARDRMIHQNTPGVDGTVEPGDRFGWTTGCGDLNGDGYDELIVATPFEEIDGTSEVGVVHVFRGGVTGVSTENSVFLSQSGPAIEDEIEPFDWFGAAIAVADFDQDGFDDLVVGVPREEVDGRFGGVVHVFPGSHDWPDVTVDRLLHQDTPGMLGSMEFEDRFGSALTTGDFDGDGFPDLAVGVPQQKVAEVRRAGAVHIIRGTTKGLTPAGDRIVDRATPGIKRDPQIEDHFGTALASGDFNADGHDDLAIGVPWADANKGLWIDAGEVVILLGTPEGLGPVGDRVFSQGTKGVRNDPNDFEHFGATLTAGDLNDDGADDLVIGVPENRHRTRAAAGGVNVLYGRAGIGLVKSGDLFVSQRLVGFFTKPEPGDRFGRTLVGGDFDANGALDVVIGVPFENLGGEPDVGLAHLLEGSLDGLRLHDPRTLQQGKQGISGKREPGDGFGWAGPSPTLTSPPS